MLETLKNIYQANRKAVIIAAFVVVVILAVIFFGKTSAQKTASTNAGGTP